MHMMQYSTPISKGTAFKPFVLRNAVVFRRTLSIGCRLASFVCHVAMEFKSLIASASVCLEIRNPCQPESSFHQTGLSLGASDRRTTSLAQTAVDEHHTSPSLCSECDAMVSLVSLPTRVVCARVSSLLPQL